MTEANVLNRIEKRIREHKPVSQREVFLLVESYTAFNVSMPKDILNLLKGGL